KEPLSFTALSTITETIELRSGLADSAQFAGILVEIAEKYRKPGTTLLLIGTNDLYVRLIIENTALLKEHFAFNYINEKLMNDLQVKSNFYTLCKQYGIETPTTFFYDCKSEEPFEEEMMFPVIVKPSNGIEYNLNKFEGQQKVYKVENQEELQGVIQTITASGY